MSEGYKGQRTDFARHYEMLSDLGRGWTVVLSCQGAAWTLELLPLADAVRAGLKHTYIGTLASVIARAYAGERGDS